MCVWDQSSWHRWVVTASTVCVVQLGAVAHWWSSWPIVNMLAHLCSCQRWTFSAYFVTINLFSPHLMNFTVYNWWPEYWLIWLIIWLTNILINKCFSKKHIPPHGPRHPKFGHPKWENTCPRCGQTGVQNFTPISKARLRNLLLYKKCDKGTVNIRSRPSRMVGYKVNFRTASDSKCLPRSSGVRSLVFPKNVLRCFSAATVHIIWYTSQHYNNADSQAMYTASSASKRRT